MKKKLEKCIIHKKVERVNLFMFFGICYTVVGILMLFIGIFVKSLDWLPPFIASLAGFVLMLMDSCKLFRTEEVEQEVMIERR